MPEIHALEHPLVAHHLAQLREKKTRPLQFRAHADCLTTALVWEATADLPTEPCLIATPVGPATGCRLAPRIGIFPILRAGLGMSGPALELLPEAEVWHLGLYRDEETLQPVEYYRKLPAENPVQVALVVDPMLATGGSATAAIASVERWGVGRVKLLTLIAAPEGVERVHRDFPDTQIYTCAIDEKLNEKGYIVPGLGDAGDRLFNAAAK